jgi:hypothetical protein
MQNRLLIFLCVLLASPFGAWSQTGAAGGKIDRFALVTRHNVIVQRFDSLSSLSVGNGEFAFTVDPTGLQTFPEYYEKGVPLGTQSQWGWHSFTNPYNYQRVEVWKNYTMNGRQVPYLYAHNTPPRKKDASDWLRANPHRMQLGVIGLNIIKRDGTPARMQDIQNIRQELNLWTGEINSYFEVEHIPVNVRTVCHPQLDMMAATVRSPLVTQHKISVHIRFPYPKGDWEGTSDWQQPEKHKTTSRYLNDRQVLFERELDLTYYHVLLQWSGEESLYRKAPHDFYLQHLSEEDQLSFSCHFTKATQPALPSSDQKPGPAAPEAAAYRHLTASVIAQDSRQFWNEFWQSGGAVDLSGSTDPRAKELERRIVLSQYLTRIQCAGTLPPQETGLTYNSWYGKFHMEMHWWHAAHFALWNRPALLERSLPWYAAIMRKAKETATHQGFKGVRWPKMTDPSGNESPSPVGPFLIWQQPHFIYLAELCYRDHPDKQTLEQYKEQVFATAEFMASYPWYDSTARHYVLGPGLIPAQERFDPATTVNPAFELAYWRWALRTAQQWRQRLGMAPDPEWEKVLTQLAPYPSKDGLYLAAASAPDSYTNPRYMTDHPTVLGIDGFVPPDASVDTAMLLRTFKKIWTDWSWEDTWGWDYPLVAMTAARLGQPEAAVDVLLKEVVKNTFLPNGHNYQRDNLRIYLPGNGGLLSAIAMMCAGWDGYTGPDAPGFPKNGKWKVRWEGLQKMP